MTTSTSASSSACSALPSRGRLRPVFNELDRCVELHLLGRDADTSHPGHGSPPGGLPRLSRGTTRASAASSPATALA